MAHDAFDRAAARLAAGDPTAAEILVRELLAAEPEHPDGNALLGMLLARAGKRVEALPHWRKAAERAPKVAGHRYNLAELLRQLGRPADAEPEFRAAVALAPTWAEAHFGLANALKNLDRPGEALSAYNRAIELNPRFARALYNRANLHREEGRLPAAEADYRAALVVDPNLTDAVVNLAAVLGDSHRWVEAECCYRQALDRRPEDTDLAISLADSLASQGRTRDAASVLQSVESRRPDSGVTRFRRQTLLPPVAGSAAEVAADWKRLAEVLESARQDPPLLALERLHHTGLEPPTALAYQGEDVRPVLEAFAALYAPQIRPLEHHPRGEGQPRVGVVVTRGHEGVYDRCLGGVVERIARMRRIDVTVISSRAGVNVLRHLRPSFPGEYLATPARVDAAAERIREARFDVLHYWEVGTDATNYFLPYFRPAAMQCATWGWPVTTGNPRVDWYVSAAPLEPPGAESHYTERLALLESLPTCYARPPALPTPGEPAARRKAFGVDATTPVYLCPQNLRKVHSDFDSVLAAILESDPHGRVVFVADEQPRVTEALLSRLGRSLGPDARRVGVVARHDRADYLRLVSCADVLLDTPHYGGGANTVADALACGTPVITLPGRFHRGRWMSAVLRQAGLSELVTESPAEYARVAVQVATDEDYRRGMSKQLRAFGDEWFDDSHAAAELEEFWLARISGRER